MNYNHVLTIGDLLSRPKLLGLMEHYGVVVGPNAIFHNTPQKGEHVSPMADFAAGEKVKVRRTGADPWGVIARLRKALARPQKYDLATRNCEHTVTEVLSGIPKSPTFVVVALIAVAVVLYLFFRGR